MEVLIRYILINFYSKFVTAISVRIYPFMIQTFHPYIHLLHTYNKSGNVNYTKYIDGTKL